MHQISGVEDRVLRGELLRTSSGPEGSSDKQKSLGAVGLPDWSWLLGKLSEDYVRIWLRGKYKTTLVREWFFVGKNQPILSFCAFRYCSYS